MCAGNQMSLSPSPAFTPPRDPQAEGRKALLEIAAKSFQLDFIFKKGADRNPYAAIGLACPKHQRLP